MSDNLDLNKSVDSSDEKEVVFTSSINSQPLFEARPVPYVSIEPIALPTTPPLEPIALPTTPPLEPILTFVPIPELPLGWKFITKKRMRGNTKGRIDRYWISPKGTKYNSLLKLKKVLDKSKEG